MDGFDVVVIKKDGEYYLYHNSVTEDEGKVFFEVVTELIEVSNSIVVFDFEELSEEGKAKLKTANKGVGEWI